jgi:hypothetical protein
MKAMNLEKLLIKVRINHRPSLLKLIPILEMYNEQSSYENMCLYFENVPDHTTDEDTIAFSIAVGNKIGEPLLWREEHHDKLLFEEDKR